MVIAVNILFYKWSNTNGVTKSPTAPQEAMAQLDDTGVGPGTFVTLKGACGKTTTINDEV